LNVYGKVKIGILEKGNNQDSIKNEGIAGRFARFMAHGEN
jgi:hypothetical protein